MTIRFLAEGFDTFRSDCSNRLFCKLLWSSILLDANPSKPGWLKKLLDNQAIDQSEKADTKTDQVLLKRKRDCAHSCTTIFDKCCLDKNGCNDDENEEPIVEEALEHVVLLVAELARVNLIEDLHKHERVEDNRVEGYLI